MIITSVLGFIEISSQKKAIELLQFITTIWTRSSTQKVSKEIVFIIQSASLVVDVSGLVFKHIFITLRDIGNQEISKNNKQEDDDNYEECPNANDHQL